MTAAPALLIPSDLNNLKRNNFDAIRLTMALAVVWSHSFALFYGSEKTEPTSILLSGAYNAGNLGVMVFFVISGFLVTKSFFSSDSLLQFIMRRIRRVYPGYLVATSICAFVIIPIYAHLMNMTVGEVIKTLGANLFLRNYFPPSNAFTANPTPNVVNGSLWSIPFEFWCYIGIAALGIVGLANRRWFLVAVTVVVLLGRVMLDLLEKKPGGGVIGLIIGFPYLWFVILPNFLLGMIAYAFKDIIPRSRVLLIVLIAGVLASTFLNHNLAHLLVPPALAYGALYVAFSRSFRLHRTAQWGDFSYGTYLYAFPIQQMLIASLITKISFFAYVPIAMALAVGAGVMSWHLVERWFIQSRYKMERAPATGLIRHA